MKSCNQYCISSSKVYLCKIVDPDGVEIPPPAQVPTPAVAPDTEDKNQFPELGAANKDPTNTAGTNNKDSPGCQVREREQRR